MDFEIHNGVRAYCVSIGTDNNGRYYVEIAAAPTDEEVPLVERAAWDGWGHVSTVPFYTQQSAYVYACNIVYDQTIDPDLGSEDEHVQG